MNLRFHIICVVCILTLTSPVSAVADSTAIVHGVTYRWDNIEPLDSTVVEINSTPPQSMVARNGEYSFELGPGVYNITARYYQNGALACFTEETFEVKEGGNYVYDLLLKPVSQEADESAMSSNNTSGIPSSNDAVPITETSTAEDPSRNNSNITSIPDKISTYPSITNYLLILFVLFFLLAGGYGIFRNHKTVEKSGLQREKRGNKAGSFFKFVKTNELSTKVPGKNVSSKMEEKSRNSNERIVSLKESEPKTPEGLASNPNAIKKESSAESLEYSAKKIGSAESGLEEESKKTYLEESAPKRKPPLSVDLQEVVDVIRGNGGRITQKDLRSRLKYSEVKVSLLLSELEKKDLIKKLKRGRENILILRDENL
jgi:uncharacterized membrane protein